MKWFERLGEHVIWVLIFHVLCQKIGDCEVKSRKKSSIDRYTSKNAVLCPALLNRKPSYLMQYLVSSDTNMESVIFGNKIIMKKKSRKKIYYHVYIYLTNVKGFFPFHVCILWKQNPTLFDFRTSWSFLVVFWVSEWNDWTSGVPVSCESYVSIKIVCAWISLKPVRVFSVCEPKCLEIYTRREYIHLLYIEIKTNTD